eukprot:TRINITY_DN22494_c0_g2_i1.p1 TRINITY_DN22494_c0_g2~~TRINITY_DN22494_c0_g2_i1.p1  ORF type:complete len:482 (+),score=79.19 TRINITY_DN22494_c0_g2_i1:51-1448(+)
MGNFCGGRPTSRSVQPELFVEEVVIGSLNLLGDAYNPFEFLSNDASFSSHYKKLEQTALSLTLEQFLAGLGALDISGVLDPLRSHCEAGKSIWSFFDESRLNNDNKFLQPRLNLITFAMRSHGSESTVAWQLLDTWTTSFATLCASGGSSAYEDDPNLLIFDAVCNVVASLTPDSFRSICSSSPLNPLNFERLAQNVVEALTNAAGDRPLVIGIQEWPRGDTPKARAFEAAMNDRDLCVRCTSEEAGVAVVYSRSLGAPTFLDDLMGQSVQIMQKVLDDSAAKGDALDEKAVAGFLDATARKVLLLRFPDASAPDLAATTFYVGHVKEPKTQAAARVLARFAHAFGSAAASGTNSFAAMMDTNLGSEAVNQEFASELAASGLDAVPGPAVATTSKQRSLLHGQTYNESKCLKVVSASKDKLVARQGLLSNVSVFPQLDDASQGLPSPTWISDHALVTAVLKLKSA